MSERVAIVAGAGGELGRATAQKLAAAGFTVVGVDRSEEGLKELPDGIRRETADSADPAAARAVVDRSGSEGHGQVEVLGRDDSRASAAMFYGHHDFLAMRYPCVEAPSFSGGTPPQKTVANPASVAKRSTSAGGSQ